jgi:REP element-mobilizing transposase RayT
MDWSELVPRDPFTYERGRRTGRADWIDYAWPGRYFVTVSTYERECLFGDVRAGEPQINQLGRIVEACWRDLPNHYGRVALDAFVVMPNHVHGIIELRAGQGAEVALPEVVRALKTESSRRINSIRGTRGVPVWHRSFHDRIVHTDEQLALARAYIAANPQRWIDDALHPERNVESRHAR